MALIKSYRGISPQFGRECYLSENATVVGDVRMGDECSIWFNAVLRGDVARVILGHRCNVQDGSCLHVTNFGGKERPSEDFINGNDIMLEDDVTVGHNATLHACHIKARRTDRHGRYGARQGGSRRRGGDCCWRTGARRHTDWRPRAVGRSAGKVYKENQP